MLKKIGINQKTISNTYYSFTKYPKNERFGKIIEFLESNGFVVTNSSYKRILKLIQNENKIIGLLK